jgi:hypothetical protein
MHVIHIKPFRSLYEPSSGLPAWLWRCVAWLRKRRKCSFTRRANSTMTRSTNWQSRSSSLPVSCQIRVLFQRRSRFIPSSTLEPEQGYAFWQEHIRIGSPFRNASRRTTGPSSGGLTPARVSDRDPRLFGALPQANFIGCALLFSALYF